MLVRMKKLVLSLAFLCLPVVSFAKFEDWAEFPSWSEEVIELVKDEGIMTGYADGTFRPQNVINRAEALVILFRIKGIEMDDVEFIRNFSDVPRGEWFADAVTVAVDRGWVEGYPDGTFRPDQPINNAEWATILQRAFELEVNEDNFPSFSDVPSRVWFGDAVGSLYNNDLIRLSTAHSYYPSTGVSRAEVAWTSAKILKMPRLLGTSAGNDFTGPQRGSTRTAMPRGSDFNPNLQGYDIARSAIYIETNADKSPVVVGRSSDWISIGQLRFTNNLDDLATIESLELKLRFESTAVGPDQNFMIKITGGGMERESGLDRTGAVLFGGMTNTVEPGEMFVVHVKIKPQDGEFFYSKSGEGAVSLENLIGSTTGVATSGDNEGKKVYRVAPVEFVARKLTPIRFEP